MPRRLWVAAACCAVLPDIDVLWHSYVRWGTWLAHRGFTHSLSFAFIVGPVAAYLCFRDPSFAALRWRYAAALSLATASHGLLDAMAPYGTHVMLFWPFSTHRYVLPWSVFDAERLPWPRTFAGRVFRVAKNEFLWGWIPSILLLTATAALRRGRLLVSRNGPNYDHR